MKKIKRILTVSMGTALGLAGSLAIGSVPGHAAVTPKPTTPSGCQFVWLISHQDDELLTMGAGIRQHVNAQGGAKVCAVMMTTGVGSGVKNAMKNPSFNPDGKAYYLTDEQFRTARDKETWNALVHMGVPASNIYLNGYGTPSTGVSRIRDVNNGSAEQAAKIDGWMKATINYFGTPRHYKTMTDLSSDTGDHREMGRTLRRLSTTPGYGTKISSARFYVEPYRRSSVTVPVGNVVPTAADKVQLRKANNSFRVWDPARGYYRIGYRSVTSLFNAHYNNPISYQHS